MDLGATHAPPTVGNGVLLSCCYSPGERPCNRKAAEAIIWNYHKGDWFGCL